MVCGGGSSLLHRRKPSKLRRDKMVKGYIAIIKTAKTVQGLFAVIRSILGTSNETKTETTAVATPENLADYRNIQRCAYLTANKIRVKLHTQNPSLDLPKLPPTRCLLRDILAWCEAVEEAILKAETK